MGIVGNEVVSGARRWLRRLGLGLAVLALFLALLVAAMLAAAEWRARMAPPARVPAHFEVAAAANGDRNAPVLILLHGAGLNGHMWDAVQRHLDGRYRIIALDLPGHGAHRSEVYSLESSNAVVAAAARWVAPAPVILVGDSLGCYSAMSAAAGVPREQLRGLVLAGCGVERKLRDLFGYATNLVMVDALSAFVDEATLSARALSHFGLEPADRQAILAAGVNLRAVPMAQRALMFGDFRARLSQITQPVLAMNGTLDHNAMRQEPDFLATAAQATSHHVENSPHGVSMRRSTEFAAQVNLFAARVLNPNPAAKP